MDITQFSIILSSDDSHREFLKTCYEYAAENSPHPSTHTAALLVIDDEIILSGVNELPPGVESRPERFEGENKHVYPNHAERDVLYRAARQGIATDGLMMVMPWLPCIACGNAVITSGVKTLLVHKQMIERTSERWCEELANAVEILGEAGVGIVAYDGVVGAKAYMHSKEWDA